MGGTGFASVCGTSLGRRIRLRVVWSRQRGLRRHTCDPARTLAKPVPPCADISIPGVSAAQPMSLAKRFLYGEVVDQILAQEDVTKNLSAADRDRPAHRASRPPLPQQAEGEGSHSDSWAAVASAHAASCACQLAAVNPCAEAVCDLRIPSFLAAIRRPHFSRFGKLGSPSIFWKISYRLPHPC